MKNTKLISPIIPRLIRGDISGFTIIECLVAIAIVSILMTVIAPVISLAVGNRVQARRVELATQAARDYVNGIQAGVIEAPRQTIRLSEVDSGNNFVSQRTAFANVYPPSTSGSLLCRATTSSNFYCSNSATSSLYCVDLDGNGCTSNSGKDLLIQAFRSVTPVSADADKGYLLGVRVYRADGFGDKSPLLKSDPKTKRTQLTFSGGMGKIKAPLVEMTTEIVNNQANMQDFCDRLGCQGTQ